jgi:hypothetical protein
MITLVTIIGLLRLILNVISFIRFCTFVSVLISVGSHILMDHICDMYLQFRVLTVRIQTWIRWMVEIFSLGFIDGFLDNQIHTRFSDQFLSSLYYIVSQSLSCCISLNDQLFNLIQAFF